MDALGGSVWDQITASDFHGEFEDETSQGTDEDKTEIYLNV